MQKVFLTVGVLLFGFCVNDRVYGYRYVNPGEASRNQRG